MPKRWPPFVNGESSLALDIIARRYAQRPSAIMGITEPYLAYCFDEAIALRGLEHEMRDQNGGQRRAVAVTSRNNLTFTPGGMLTGRFSGVIGEY